MQKLIMEYGAGDDCTYWFTVTVPFVYESIEVFKYDFMKAWMEAFDKDEPNFSILGENFKTSTFCYLAKEGVKKSVEFIDPEVYDLEEWFEKKLVNKV